MNRAYLAYAPLAGAAVALLMSASCVLDRAGTKAASETGGGGAGPTTGGFGGSPVGGFGGSPTVGGNGGTGGNGCMTPTECPGTDETCQFRTCVANVCGTEMAPDNTPCTENGGALCESGQCVQWSPTMLSGLALWLRGDTDVTLSGPSVTAWANQGSVGGSFVQGTATGQPTTGTLNGETTVRWDGVDDVLRFDGAASAWSFLHDGSGATLFVVFVPTTPGTVVDSLRLLETRIGMSLQYQPNTLSWRIGNGAVPYVVDASTSALVGQPHTVVLRVDNGASPQFSYRVDRMEVSSGALGAVPTAADPFGPLALGNLVLEGEPFGGDIAEVGAVGAYLDLADVDKLESYIASRYGL